MTDVGSADPGPTSSNVSALVEAIDARARQAGSESAATLVSGMLGSVSEMLGSIQDRIDHVESLLVDRAHPESTVVEQVSSSLQTFNARLGRLEEAFVQAVEDSGSGTDAVVDEVRAAIAASVAAAVREAMPAPVAAAPVAQALAAGEELRTALYRIEMAIKRLGDDRSPDPAEIIGSALVAMAERLDGLEERLSSGIAAIAAAPILDRLDAVDARLSVDPTASLVERIRPIVDRLVAIEELIRDRPEPPPPPDLTALLDLAAPLEEALAPLRAKLDGLEVAFRGTGDEPQLSLQPEVLARLEDAVDALERGEAAARLVHLVEERLGAGVRAVAERAESTRQAIDDLDKSRAADQRRVEDLANAVRALGNSIERLPEQVGAVHGQPAPLEGLVSLDGVTAAVAALNDRIDGSIRREAELLTQRVAALAVGVEAARVMLEQHVAETENSLGRKATEVTRRLAADLGIGKPKKRGRRDPRELGRGGR